ncbi:hypothetical protein D4R52_00320, partial [bacterium]
MAEPIGDNFISLADAAKLLGKSRDYLNVLIRRGKLHARKIGLNWVTTQEWINEFQKQSISITLENGLVPLSEAAKVLGTSRDYLNVLVRRGKLKAKKSGRNWATTKEWINEYLANKNGTDANPDGDNKSLELERMRLDHQLALAKLGHEENLAKIENEIRARTIEKDEKVELAKIQVPGIRLFEPEEAAETAEPISVIASPSPLSLRGAPPRRGDAAIPRIDEIASFRPESGLAMTEKENSSRNDSQVEELTRLRNILESQIQSAGEDKLRLEHSFASQLSKLENRIANVIEDKITQSPAPSPAPLLEETLAPIKKAFEKEIEELKSEKQTLASFFTQQLESLKRELEKHQASVIASSPVIASVAKQSQSPMGLPRSLTLPRNDQDYVKAAPSYSLSEAARRSRRAFDKLRQYYSDTLLARRKLPSIRIPSIYIPIRNLAIGVGALALILAISLSAQSVAQFGDNLAQELLNSKSSIIASVAKQSRTTLGLLRHFAPRNDNESKVAAPSSSTFNFKLSTSNLPPPPAVYEYSSISSIFKNIKSVIASPSSLSLREGLKDDEAISSIPGIAAPLGGLGARNDANGAVAGAFTSQPFLQNLFSFLSSYWQETKATLLSLFQGNTQDYSVITMNPHREPQSSTSPASGTLSTPGEGKTGSASSPSSPGVGRIPPQAGGEVSLQGPQGDKGDQGVPGPQGPQGPVGPSTSSSSNQVISYPSPAASPITVIGNGSAKDGSGIVGSFKYLSSQEFTTTNAAASGNLSVTGQSTLGNTSVTNLTATNITSGTLTTTGQTNLSRTTITDSALDYVLGLNQTGTGSSLRFLSSPSASSTIALIQMTDNPMSSGSTSGTFLGMNPQSFQGDFERFQVNGQNRFTLDNAGSLAFAGNLTSSTTTASSTFAHSLIVNTSDFVVNANEHRVGVGTTAPTQMLSVGSGSPFNVTSAGAVTNAGETINGSLNMSVGDWGGIHINGTGAGLNQEFQMGKLQIFTNNDSSSSGGVSFYVNGGGTLRLAQNRFGINGGTIASASDADLTIASATGEDYLNVGAGKFYITYGGSVGIGNTSPTSTLAVNGTLGVVNGAYFGGNVGIGNTSPTSTLSVVGSLNIQKTTSLDSSLYVNSTTGNVGIGTTGPTTKLQIFGGSLLIDNGQWYQALATDGTTRRSLLQLDTSNNTVLNTPGGQSMFLNVGGSTKVTMDSGGNVGIGTTDTGSYKLSVIGNMQVRDGSMRIDASSPTLTFSDYGATWSPLSRIISTADGGSSWGDPRLTFGTVKSGGYNDELTLKNGNVGIGTTNPLATLQIKSGTYTGAQIGATAGLYTTSTYFTDLATLGTVINLARSHTAQFTQSIFTYSNAGDVKDNLGIVSLDDIKFVVGPVADRGMIIQNTGNVGIGTTNPLQALDVNGHIRIEPDGSNSKYLMLGTDQTGTGGLTIQAGRGSAGFGGAINLYSHLHATRPGSVIVGLSTNSSDGRFAVNNQGLGGGTDVFTVKQNGAVGIGVTTIASLLDVAGNVSIGSYAGVSGAPSLGMIVSGNVGIGTTNPSYGKLVVGDGTAAAQSHMNGSTAGGAGFFFREIGTIRGGLQFSSPDTYLDYSGSLHVRTSAGSGADSMTILTGGNIGIGTTAPQTALDVVVAANGKMRIGSSSTLTNGQYTMLALGSVRADNNYDKTAIAYSSTGDGWLRGNFHILQNNVADGTSATLANAVFTVTSGGNVGIGTTDPGAKLDIMDSNATGAAIRLREGATNGTEYIGLKAPDAITTSKTYILPATVGTVNQVLSLVTVATGELGWAANSSSGMSNPLTITGDTIYASNTATPATAARLAIGTAGQCLVVSAGLLPSWGACSGTAGVAGSTTQVQYNLGGVLSATANFTWDNTNLTLSSLGSVDGDKTSLALRNTSTGNTAVDSFHIGNNTAVDTLDLWVNSSANTTGANSAFMFNRQAAPLVFGTTNAERMRIDAGGNVGVGTTAPAQKLDVRNLNTDYQLRLGDSAADAYTYSVGRVSASGSFSIYGNQTTAGAFKFGNIDNGTLFTITNAGNVGIGTTNPGTKLDIKGTYQARFNTEQTATGELPAGVAIYGLSNNLSLIGDGAGIAGNKLVLPYYNQSQFYSALEVANVASGYGNLLLMKSGGNVGIGTTGPNYLLEVKQAGANPGINILNTTNQRATIGFGLNSGLTSGWIMGQDSAYNGTKNFYLYDTSNSAFRLVVDTAGNVGIGTTTPGAKLSFGTLVGSNTIDLYEGAAGARYGMGIQSAEMQFYIPTGTGNRHFSFNAGGDLQTSGTNELMRIDTAGNVGIGTTTPTSKLSISGNGIMQNWVGGGTAFQYFRAANTNVDLIWGIDNTTGGGLFVGSLANSASFGTVGASAIHLATNNTARLSIDASGNIG